MPESSAERHKGREELKSVILGESRVYGIYAGLKARTTALGQRLRRVVTASFVYRWLTKEPEPEVVVIDLRETWTVGPIISLLDATIDHFQPYWEASTLKTGVDWTIELVDAAADTRVGRALAAVLAPPEPPERTTKTDSTATIEEPEGEDDRGVDEDDGPLEEETDGDDDGRDDDGDADRRGGDADGERS